MADMMGTGAIGQSFGHESNLSNLEGLREQLKMLEGAGGASLGGGLGGKDGRLGADGEDDGAQVIDQRHFDEFEQVQFGAEFAEISKLARNIEDEEEVSIDSARVDLKELGGDELHSNINLNSLLNNNLSSQEDDQQQLRKSSAQDLGKQKRASGAIRKAAGTGDVENSNRMLGKHHGNNNHYQSHQRSGSNEKLAKNINNQQSITSNKEDLGRENEESESCYINQSEIQSNPSQSQSQSVVTTERSHFTSIEGPPKVYEEIMRQLEADIRKHIRIEHQLKLHIESVEDRVEELEREQEQNEKATGKEVAELKKEVEQYKEQVKEKDKEVEDVKQDKKKQIEQIEQVYKDKEAVEKEKDTLLEQIKKLKEENASLQVDLKVARSQNQRDKETIIKLQNDIQADTIQKKNLANFDPYQPILDDSNKKYHNMNAFEFGPGSGLSGNSGVSAVSNNSALSSNNPQLTRSQKNQHQFSSLNQQQNHQMSYDQLTMSDNRAVQECQQINQIAVDNYMDGNIQRNLNDLSDLINQQDLPYNHNNLNQLQQQQNSVQMQSQAMFLNKMTVTNTQSAKNLTSISEQNTVMKKNLAGGPADQNQQSSKLSIKQSSHNLNANNQNKQQQSSQSIGTSSLDKPNQASSSKYASCSPGMAKPTFVMNQQQHQQSNMGQQHSVATAAGGNSGSSKSNRIRPKKIQKHQSLEKFSNAALYGTQVVGAANQSLIVPGSGPGTQAPGTSGSAGLTTQQQQIKTAGAFPVGPEVQIKMQQVPGSAQINIQSSKKSDMLQQNEAEILNMKLNQSNTPDKLKIKPSQLSGVNARSKKEINNYSNITGNKLVGGGPHQQQQSSQQQRDGSLANKKQLLQKSTGENIQSSSESLMHKGQQNQSRSHSQQNLYSQSHIQLQSQGKLLGKNVNVGAGGVGAGNGGGGGHGGKQGVQHNNLIHFQNGSGHSNTSNSIKKLTSNAQLQNIYRVSNLNNSSGRSDGQVSQSRSKSTKQQFRGNKNISGGSNITTFNSIVTIKASSQQASHIANNLDHQHFYQSAMHPVASTKQSQAGLTTTQQNNRISIMAGQGQSNNSRNSILKIYNTVGAPNIQKKIQGQHNSMQSSTSTAMGAGSAGGNVSQQQNYSSKKQLVQQSATGNATGHLDQIAPQSTVIRPVSSSKNSRKAIVGLEMHAGDGMGHDGSNNEAKRVLHQNLIYIGNQNIQKGGLINQGAGASNQKFKKQQDPINIQKIKVQGVNDGQQHYQVALSKYQYNTNTMASQESLLQPQPQQQTSSFHHHHQYDQNLLNRNLLMQAENSHSQQQIPGFVDSTSLVACGESLSTGATGGTSTGAALQRRRSQNQRDSGVQQQHQDGVQTTQTFLHSNSSNLKQKTRDRNNNNGKKGGDPNQGKPLTATVNSQNQSLNNTQKIRQTSQKQTTIASGGVIVASQIVSGPGTQSTKRSLSKKSQYAAIVNANGGQSPAPKNIGSKLTKMQHGMSVNERHQASSFRQLAAGQNSKGQGSLITKSSSNLEQQHVQTIIRPNRNSSNSGNTRLNNSKQHRQVGGTLKSVTATTSSASEIKTTTAGGSGLGITGKHHEIQQNCQQVYKS